MQQLTLLKHSFSLVRAYMSPWVTLNPLPTDASLGSNRTPHIQREMEGKKARSSMCLSRRLVWYVCLYHFSFFYKRQIGGGWPTPKLFLCRKCCSFCVCKNFAAYRVNSLSGNPVVAERLGGLFGEEPGFSILTSAEIFRFKMGGSGSEQ